MITLVIGKGFITAHTPSTIRRLKMFEPTTLLSAISFEPLRAAEVLTASSGALVPNATIVSPIMTDGTLNIAAIDELPSTKRSAPFTKATNPATSRIIFNTISIVFSLSLS